MRCALVPEDGTYLVENIIDAAAGNHIAGYRLIPSETAQPGDIYDPESGAFRTREGRDDAARKIARAELEKSDKEMARAAEDILDILLARGIIEADDLPPAARARMERRAELRLILAGGGA
jgi:hypothetical protein